MESGGRAWLKFWFHLQLLWFHAVPGRFLANLIPVVQLGGSVGLGPISGIVDNLSMFTLEIYISSNQRSRRKIMSS